MSEDGCAPGGRQDVATNPWGRILIAEDDDQVRQFIAELLHQEGYRCDCVGTAEEAVRSLTTNAYDLFITDIRMPDNETLSFLQACQNGVSSVPVIVITGYPSIRTAVEAVRLSVVDYLVKPINDAALRSSVNLAIGKGRVLRSLRRTREEMHIWSEAMDRLEQSLVASESADARTKGAWPVEHVLRQTMVLFSQVVAGLKATLETAKRESPSQRNPDVCMLVQCSKGAVYEEALRRSVEVLMNTKRSFKSKELGDLRKTLVGVLEREARR